MKSFLQILLLFFISTLVKAQSLTISPRSKLVMKGSVSLVVRNAALVNNGTLMDSAGTVHFTGHKDTSVSYLGGTQATSLYNLTVDKSSSGTVLKSPVAVQNVLGVYAGVLYPDSNLTLRSDNSLTARVDVIPAGADIRGKAMVERYFPNRRSWRLITSPLTATTSIFDTWQNKGVYQAGTNTFVTGPNPTGAAGNGLDASPQNNSSMKTWNVATQSLEPVLNTYAKLSQGNDGNADNTGYFMFVRGDRNTSNFYLPNSTNTTLSSNGQLQVGTQNFTVSAVAGGYTLIGNPFASPVDFNAVVRNNVVKRFYVWDPSLNTVGGYVMLDDLDNNGLFTKTISISPQTQHIQSGQAFFVETQTGGAASINFPEPCKSSGNNNALFRPMAEPSLQSIRVMVSLKENDSTLIPADGVLVECSNGYSNSTDRDDALKFGNVNETLSLTRNGFVLAAERKQPLTGNDTLFLKLTRTTQRKYEFEIAPAGIDDNNLQAWLEDSYVNTSTPLSLQQNTAIEFSIDANAGSAAANRFRIIFKRMTTLPVTILSLNAYLQNKYVQVNWEVESEINIGAYEVEKSVDGIHFTTMDTKAALNASIKHQYASTDKRPAAGYNFYRIKYIDKDGTEHYSNIVKVDAGNTTAPSINISPNPVHGNTIHLQFINCAAGIYHVRLLDASGKLLYEGNIENINAATAIHPAAYLPAAAYWLEISDGVKAPVTKKVMVAE